MSIAKKIEIWAEKKGIKKKALAEKMGTSVTNLANLFAERRRISEGELVKLSEQEPELIAFIFGILPSDAEEAQKMVYLLEEEERLESMSELEKLTEIYVAVADSLPETARKEIEKKIEELKKNESG